MHRTVWLVAMLLLPVAAAQGPAPGYDDAVSYAVDHAGAQADNATSDPLGYAQDHASPQAVQAQANHTLYMVCWAADDHGAQHDVCDPYYTPRGQAAPEQPPQEHNATHANVTQTLNATHAFVDEVADAVNDTVADPASAPSQIERILNATTSWLATLADQVLGVVDEALDGLEHGLHALGAAGDGLARGGLAVSQGAADAVLAMGEGLASGATAATGALATGTEATVGAVAAAGKATGAAIGTASHAMGDGLQAAARAVGDGVRAAAGAVADAGKAVGHAVADAGKAVGTAVADTASRMRQAITGVIDPPAEVETPRTPDLPQPEGLLDDITGLVP